MPTCKERILSNDYSDILIDFELPESYADDFSEDYCYHKLGNDSGILYVRRNQITDVTYAESGYLFLPKCYGLMQQEAMSDANLNTLSLSVSGILSVQNPPLNLTGKKVTIGFIGSGIRYNNPVFKDSTGRSRILSIWDQSIQDGVPPEGFEYGTEYTNEMINQALVNENPLSIVPSTDSVGHGSAMASVAAGSISNNGQFKGAAPDSRIVVVKLKEAKPYLKEFYKIKEDAVCYSETDILQAIQYLQKYVKIFEEPLVICLGIGTSMGDHTGVGMMNRYIDFWCNKKSRVFVIAGGNEGNASHHYRGEVTKEQNFRDVELRVGENEKGFTMELWGDAPNFYIVEIKSPGGESILWDNPRSFLPLEFSFVFESTIITIDSLLTGEASDVQLVRMRFMQPTQGVWNIKVTAKGDITGGYFDIWLPITSFISENTYFLEPNPYITITEPAYARGAIAVSAYQMLNESIYVSSGRGYARDNSIVPDVSAPGVDVSTPFGNITGTSISAAITAGGCAQLMEWAVVQQKDILVNSFNIKNYITRGAARDNGLRYPSREWGYGRLDIQGVFEFLAGR